MAAFWGETSFQLLKNGIFTFLESSTVNLGLAYITLFHNVTPDMVTLRKKNLQAKMTPAPA